MIATTGVICYSSNVYRFKCFSKNILTSWLNVADISKLVNFGTNNIFQVEKLITC